MKWTRLLPMLALMGCHTLKAPPDMTVNRATRIIQDHMERVVGDGAAHYRGEYLCPFTPIAGELSFQYATPAGSVDLHDPSAGRDGQTVRVPLFKVRDVSYADLGMFNESYSARNLLALLTFFFVGPTIVEVKYAPRLWDGRASPTPDFAMETNTLNVKRLFLSLIPLWLLGLPFLVTTDEEELLQALSFLRDYNPGLSGG